MIIPALGDENDCFFSSTSHFGIRWRTFRSGNYWPNDRQRVTFIFKTFSPLRDFLGFAAQQLSPCQLQGFVCWGNHNDKNTEMTKSHPASYFCTRCVLQSTQLWGEIRKWNSVKQNNQGRKETQRIPSDQKNGHGRKMKFQFQPEIVLRGVSQICLTLAFFYIPVLYWSP